jgi:thioredoxin reductase
MKDYDVLVVGGGAAGLSAALVLLRARRTVVLVDAGAPRNAPAAHMPGFLSRVACHPAGSSRWAGPRWPAMAVA